MDHHYLPQFYLRRWANADGKVLRYREVPSGKVVAGPVAPRGTAFEPDLYAVPPAVTWEGHDPNILETDVFSPIDSDAALVLEKLVTGEVALSLAERRAWSLFLNSLRFRHRDEILERDAESPRLAADYAATFLARYGGGEARARAEDALANIDLALMAKNAHRTAMVQAIRAPERLSEIESLAWQVLAVVESAPLVTSDRPLLTNLGREGPVQLVTIPLSPRHLFVAFPSWWQEEEVDGIDDLLAQIALAHDLMLMFEHPCRFVFASRPLDDSLTIGSTVLRLRTAVDAALRSARD